MGPAASLKTRAMACAAAAAVAASAGKMASAAAVPVNLAHILEATNQVLPGELAKHAVNEVRCDPAPRHR